MDMCQYDRPPTLDTYETLPPWEKENIEDSITIKPKLPEGEEFEDENGPREEEEDPKEEPMEEEDLEEKPVEDDREEEPLEEEDPEEEPVGKEKPEEEPAEEGDFEEQWEGDEGLKETTLN